MKRLLLMLPLLLCAASAADLQIRFLNVGQGDAVLVTTPDGKSMLYDAGRGTTAAQLLKRYGVKQLDLAVMSQGDADHIGGFEAVAQQFKPRAVLNNGLAKSTQTYARVLAAFEQAGSQGLRATERSINLGAQVKLQVLPALGVPKTNQNANSVGVLLSYGSFKVFFGGDAEPVTTKGWAQRYASQLRNVQLYKALHHGSKHNDTLEFLQLVKPEMVVIGVGKNNYGHPSSEALAVYKMVNAQVFRTDLNGTVTVSVKPDGSYTVTAEQGLGTQKTTRTTTPAPTTPAPTTEVYFRNCAEARNAGYTNIKRGESGYRSAMDRDGDGVACER
ncbi:excalibur calcium-binding domain-containing protein [Deinococcus peraridilitoris]|uniref:Putative hydrolase (Metallo-beta-lactamase superfamily) n=1 Tax=Deinococcus peraridilitoris (strain DSM 19664 / LMG 22246 / CIP 109416 / KR-200) TaxID=937777 RepID=L0A6A6_DEIPD|nr:excalibur calcium-binding domain-containing protein [Deinococcus peraridilitoris]AFZ69381.1 putative hydrolase (metallo-beta-lactamase superfamily) [Deinococcus peraridilitoris DSM 19664]